MSKVTYDERREAAARLRELHLGGGSKGLIELTLTDAIGARRENGMSWDYITERLADLIEPSCKPDAEYEAWRNSLSRGRDAQTIRGLIEEIVWATLTIDLGPNGITDLSTGIDEGIVQTDSLLTWWERELLRLSGGIDRDALLQLAEALESTSCEGCACDKPKSCIVCVLGVCEGAARYIREACGIKEGRR